MSKEKEQHEWIITSKLFGRIYRISKDSYNWHIERKIKTKDGSDSWKQLYHYSNLKNALRRMVELVHTSRDPRRSMELKQYIKEYSAIVKEFQDSLAEFKQ